MILMQVCSIWHKRRCILVCVQSAASPHLRQYLENSIDKDMNIIENNFDHMKLLDQWTLQTVLSVIENHHAKGLI